MKTFTPLEIGLFKSCFCLSPCIRKFLISLLLLLLGEYSYILKAQSSDCLSGVVQNDGTSEWSEQCYLDNVCAEQGNPCQANDVTLLGVFVADEFGGPVNTCGIGEDVSFLLWGTFHNNTSTARYAVRSCTEVWRNGAFMGEVNSCSFDVLESGDSEAILLGEFTYVCGEQIKLLNTWVGWSTTAAQCTDPSGPDFKNECGQYPPSKCSKELGFIEFLTPNFAYACGVTTASTTEVCFTNLSTGGTPGLSYVWDFGDGQTSIEEHPCHTFTTANGIYTALLLVTDANGVQAGAQVILDLENLECCALTVNSPPENGGTFDCIDDLPAPDFSLVTVLDSCGLVTITVSDVATGSGCAADTMVITRTYSIDDGSSNLSYTQVFKLVDDISPLVSCGPQIILECADDIPDPDVSSVSYTDNCSETALVTFIEDNLISQTCANRFTISRTYQVEDNCGNTATCIQSIVVFDDTPPAITCLANITVSCAANVPTPNSSAIITSDNCGSHSLVSVSADIISNQSCANRYRITRIYTATDLCGNSSSCVQTINVLDSTAPTLTCPASVTVSCVSLVPAVNISSVASSDNCDGASLVTHVGDVVSNMECINRFLVTRTYNVADACGNLATCSQSITVIDDIAPSFSCPANITVSCAGLVPEVNLDIDSAIDNCNGSVTISVAPDIIVNQSCNSNYQVLRTYIATDICGNSSTCAQIITVSDNIPPFLTCPLNVTVSCADDIPVADINTVQVSDNCNGAVSVTVTADVTTGFTCGNNFTITRTYIATDECGNSSACDQLITVSDVNVPLIACPATVNVQCVAEIPAINTAAIITTDNCAGALTVSHVSDVVTNQTCPNNFVLSRSYRSMDVCENSASCVQTINVVDSTPPAITCAADLTVECEGQIPRVSILSIDVIDDCGGNVSVSHLSDIISNQTCDNQFVLTRTYQAIDACGNSALCAQVITVYDDVAPLIVFTDPVLDGLSSGDTLYVQCYGQDPTWDLPQLDENSVAATDNCTALSVNFTQSVEDEGDCQVDGYINLYRLTWTAEDSCDNSSSAYVLMALVDNVPPVINGVPEDITVDVDAIPEPPNVYATDECLCACVVLLEESNLPSGCLNGQVITRTWKATDDCGNISMEVQHITLSDEQGPEMLMLPSELATISNGAILEFTCHNGGIPDFFAQLNAGSMNFTDLSSPSTISFHQELITANNCELSGFVTSQIFEWEALDQCGNTSAMIVEARLIDDEVPAILGLPDTTCIGSPLLANVEAIDNCGHANLRFWDVRIPNPCGNGLAVRRTYEAFDGCGNITTDTTFLIPNDQSKPTLEFVNPILADLPYGEILIVNCDLANGKFTSFNSADVIAHDGCSVGVNVEFRERLLSSGDCTTGDGVALLELMWIATDVCQNSSTLAVTARVVDEVKPVFVDLEKDISIHCDEEIPGVAANDNCGNVHLTYQENVIPGLCAFQYDILRKITATDDCGNATTETQMIHVGGLGPIIEGVVPELCEDLSIPQVTAYDPCAKDFIGVVMTQDTLESLCSEGLVIERIWTATDVCAKTTEIHQRIIIGDNIPPEMLIPNHSIILKYLDLETVPLISMSQTGIINQLDGLNGNSLTAMDDCDKEITPLFSVQIIPASNPKLDGYTQQRIYTWLAEDICGNERAISFTINILDDLPPVVGDLPGDTLIVCSPLPRVPQMVPDPNDPVEVVFSESIEDGAGSGIYIVTRTWVVSDMNGNSTVTVQRITWIPDTFLECDIILPGIVECNSHGVVISSDVTGGIEPYTYLWEIEGDECFIQGGQGTPEITIYVGWADVKIKLTVTDAYGCETVCITTLSCLEPVQSLVIGMPGDNQWIVPDAGILNVIPEVEENKEELMVHSSYWPNPADGTVNLSMEFLKEADIHLSLTNFLGQVVLDENINATKGVNYQKLNVGRLPEGSYLMRIIAGYEIQTHIIVIMR